MKVLSFAFICLLCLPAFALDQVQITEIEKAIHEKIDGKYVGVSVAIRHGGKTEYLKGFGYANRLLKRKADGGTIYRLASISKAITGTMAFALRDAGKIDLESQIRNILPGLPVHHQYETKDLLSNRSRVRHYKKWDPVHFLPFKRKNAWNATKTFMQDPLVERDYVYSTHAYTIFAAAVEEKTGESFCSNIEKMISSPGGLETLSCEESRRGNRKRSKLYLSYGEGKDKKIGVLIPAHLSWKYAGGGMEASAEDLVDFLQKLHNNEILSESTKLEMLTRPDNLANYAYGWDLGRTDKRWEYYAKSGSQTGSSTYMRTYPGEDLHIVILANTTNSGFGKLATRIAKIILK